MASNTPFSDVYKVFLSRITDDMFLELTLEETEAILSTLLLNALPYFEFPKQDIFDYDVEEEQFNVELTREEINIIATYMLVEWVNTQYATVDLTRQMYTGSDFKMTSQANHMSKLKEMADNYRQQGFHLQRLYKRRRKDSNGHTQSTFDIIMTPPKEDHYD